MCAATGMHKPQPRLILTVRVWLPAVAAVAAGSVLLMPLNRAIGVDFCYGDACTDQDMLADAAPLMYTSGIVVGYFCAYLIGALVVARDGESRWAKPVVAAVAGVALGVAQVAAAVPYAAARLGADPLGRSVADPTMLGSPGVWRAIVVSFLAFPLWAVVGLGIGSILRGRLFAASLAAPVLLAWLSLCMGKDGPFAFVYLPIIAVEVLAMDRVGFYAAAFLLGALGCLAAVLNLAPAVARRSAIRRRTGT